MLFALPEEDAAEVDDLDEDQLDEVLGTDDQPETQQEGVSFL